MWREANEWLGKGSIHNSVANRAQDGSSLPLDARVWSPSSRLMLGSSLAASIRAQARNDALDATTKHGRKPSLVIVTVGNKPLGKASSNAQRRLQLFSPIDASWFSMEHSGARLGIDVSEVFLPTQTTTQELLAELRRHSFCDGIQLMWPLPGHIDSARARVLGDPCRARCGRSALHIAH